MNRFGVRIIAPGPKKHASSPLAGSFHPERKGSIPLLLMKNKGCIKPDKIIGSIKQQGIVYHAVHQPSSICPLQLLSTLSHISVASGWTNWFRGWQSEGVRRTIVVVIVVADITLPIRIGIGLTGKTGRQGCGTIRALSTKVPWWA